MLLAVNTHDNMPSTGGDVFGSLRPTPRRGRAQLAMVACMTLTIAIANQKGGSGKTAISVNLAAGLTLRGHRVLLIDADPQGSSFKWFRRRPVDSPTPFAVIGGAQPDIDRHIPRLVQSGNYDFILIDCPAGQSPISRSALMAANQVLIPIMPTLCDFEAAEEFLPLLESVISARPGTRVHSVISRKLAGRSRESLDARAAAALFFPADGEVPVHLMASEIYERRAEVARAYGDSNTVFERPNSTSAREFMGLTEEIECLAY